MSFVFTQYSFCNSFRHGLLMCCSSEKTKPKSKRSNDSISFANSIALGKKTESEKEPKQYYIVEAQTLVGLNPNILVLRFQRMQRITLTESQPSFKP